MRLKLCALVLAVFVFEYCENFTVQSDPSNVLINRLKDSQEEKQFVYTHQRRKRYLGLSRKFKLNKRYQECVAPGDAKGHCKHLSFCAMDILSTAKNTLEYLCIIERRYVGVCCPDDIALSGSIGSLLIMDLPAGGEDYEDNENTTGCGIPAEGRSLTITKRASIQEWPWLAALYNPEKFEKGIQQQFCGGSLITDLHVLTASHCTHGLTASSVRVRLGEYNFKTPNETRYQDHGVAEIIQHEDFEVTTYISDIAIVRMTEPTTFNSYIWPICLPSSGEDYEGLEAVVAGWGQTYYGGPTSEVLLQIAVPVWPRQKCADAFIQRITDDNICAASYEGGKDSCLGDSGGPLMYQLKNGRWVVIGIVSWGIGCGNKKNPGIYTKVNNYLPWIIKNTIAKN